MENRITLKDIAKELGVSIGTVDRAIHGRGRINPETRAKVMDKIHEVGYKTNNIARALRKNQVIKIMLIAPTYNYFFRDIMRGVSDGCSEMSDYSIVLDVISADSENDPIGQMRDVEMALEHDMGGLIIVPLHPSLLQGVIDKTTQRGVPVVTVNLDSVDSKRICHVGQDSFKTGAIIGQLIGKFLCGSGRVSILSGVSDLFSWQYREEGFIDALNKNFPDIVVTGKYSYANDIQVAYEISKMLLSSDPGLSGLFANTTAGTIGIGLAIRDLGKCGQIASVCYDTQSEVMDLLDINAVIATVTQNPYLQGYFAAKIMCKVLLESFCPKDDLYYMRADIIVSREHYELNAHTINEA